MGAQDVQANLSPEQRRRFLQALLLDVRALELMLEHGLIESGICRIGAEQEMVLVDEDWQPAGRAMEILDEVEDERVTTEVARFNLECNVAPRVFTGAALREMQRELEDVLAHVRAVARRHGTRCVLTGILPTLAPEHLNLGNISDRPRYFALNEAFTTLRGGVYKLDLQGIDEVRFQHDNVLVEALNTSFQCHYQVDPKRFAAQYNVAQLLAAPMLAAGANSPILFGRRLWRETRIGIFEQTVDTRGATPLERELVARVRFGERWVDSSPLELFRTDIANFRVILGREVDEDPIDAIRRGIPPRLSALQLFNSTVYRWNRVCYGICEGRPHLRIENRVLPSGPTVVDEMANGAFWWGLMHAGVEAFGDPARRLAFEDAKANFVTAARQGMHAEVTWLDGRYVPVRDLILEELLPVARRGLGAAGIDADDADRLLGIIEERSRTRRTGAQWLLGSAAEMRGAGTRAERLAALTAGTYARQFPGDGAAARPVHEWSFAKLDEGGCWTRMHQRVGQFMTTEVLTVQPDDTIDLVISIMDWERIRHVPVEDAQHHLVGVVSYRPLLHVLAKRSMRDGSDPYTTPVREIMRASPVTVTPETATLEAIELMRTHRVSCLPVVNREGRLVGMITEAHFMRIAALLLEQQLGRGASAAETIP